MNQVAIEIPQSDNRAFLVEAVYYQDVVYRKIGKPDFPTYNHIIEATHQTLQNGVTGGSPNAGLPVVCKAFANYPKKSHHIEVAMNHPLFKGDHVSPLKYDNEGSELRRFGLAS